MKTNQPTDSAAKIRWIARCAIKLRENKPELSKEEAIQSADEIWLAAHLSLTPEYAADLASGLIKRFEDKPTISE